ncbi:MAG: rhodanese-like domain-containing protein [Ferrovibrio sp.]|uniref:rhodanese-like domain-containing protein n=1 Tax=Ferrovibrio sp. TaxID=1917215 RepID=UPI002632335E|nr:rhodanese-like domain-containing protein [Ferrovibrio sp.]MCW0235231.1 rhodanese-like domain-containing protein [Ferrovibrio sp.]
MPSPVAATSAAPAAEAIRHYSGKLAFETDCSDVHLALSHGQQDFVLLDVRGRNAYAQAHVPGALSLPQADITADRMARSWPADTLFVTYCAGPHCNGADKAALKLATLGYAVKIMIGGMTGWADEGLAYAHGRESGSVEAAA